MTDNGKNKQLEYKNYLPKILAIDIENEEIIKLRESGYNVQQGTFGYPYKCEPHKELELNGDLTCLSEKDIVIVDLNEINIKEVEKPKINTNKKSIRVSVSTTTNNRYFNSRYFFANTNKENFQKVLENKGVIIVFTEKRFSESYYISQWRGNEIITSRNLEISSYDWIGGALQIKNCSIGREILVDIRNQKLKNMCNKIISESNEHFYTCNFGKADNYDNNLFSNKFGESLGYIQYTEYNGCIIFLPQFKNKAKVVEILFQELIVNLRPDLFPEFVQNNWLNSEEYLLPEIKEINEYKKKIEEEYKEKIKEIDNEKVEIQEKQQFLTNILASQGYDEFLVDNIKKTLEFIGYRNVVDVDKEIEEGNRQEDLRILDNERFDIIEIKGHKGNPTEDDCQAVVKYMNRQMKQEKRTDIHGILVVNHNRLLPPLERTSPAFTEAQIKDAQIQDITLVSTWELYKSVRLLEKKIISFEDIDKQLHTSGLYSSIPDNWSNIGKIEHLFKNRTIACFYLELDRIAKDDVIIVQDGNNYFTQKVEEIMVENLEVQEAIKGDKLSIKINKPIGKSANIYLKY